MVGSIVGSIAGSVVGAVDGFDSGYVVVEVGDMMSTFIHQSKNYHHKLIECVRCHHCMER